MITNLEILLILLPFDLPNSFLENIEALAEYIRHRLLNGLSLLFSVSNIILPSTMKTKYVEFGSTQSQKKTEDSVGLRMGILGYRCIGRQCARLAQALGMDVHAFTNREQSTPRSRKDDSYTKPGLGDPNGEVPSRWFHWQRQSHHFLSGLDLLVITLPLTSSTEGMISHEEFKALSRRRAFVSNVGRGPIVGTNALIKSLNEGMIRGAALNVTDPEPLPKNHPLWTAKNIVITPHVSGSSTNYSQRILKILVHNLKSRDEGKEFVNKVNKSLGY
ncbi:hypothetical protein B7463_g581, partial [Scytalidium lignicola]